MLHFDYYLGQEPAVLRESFSPSQFETKQKAEKDKRKVAKISRRITTEKKVKVVFRYILGF